MWLNLVEKSITVKSIFKDETVSLDSIVLNRIEIRCDSGWNTLVGFYLSQYPSNPPEKWKKQQYDTVRLGLSFSENEILYFQNSNFTLSKGNLTITEEGVYKKIIFAEPENNLPIFIFRCKWIFVSSISACLHEEEENY